MSPLHPLAITDHRQTPGYHKVEVQTGTQYCVACGQPLGHTRYYVDKRGPYCDAYRCRPPFSSNTSSK